MEVEADGNEGLGEARPTDESHRPVVQMMRAIEVAARFEDSLARETSSSGRRTWVAVKLARTPLLSHREMKLRDFCKSRAPSYRNRLRFFIYLPIFPRSMRAILCRTRVAHA